jgi:hypothetical protein
VSGLLGFRQRPLHPALRRLRFRLLGLLSNRPRNSQRMYVVTINGQRYKRIVFPDSHQAARVATHLRSFATTGIYPSLVLERENELWVEYIEGRQVDTADAAIVGKIADLFSVLYTRDPELVAIDRTAFAHELRTDLEFLNTVGVLSDGVHDLLLETAERETPKEVWIGYDCTDAILKNFVVDSEGRLRGVDVESLNGGQLIGSGFAKAGTRWLGTHREAFLERLRDRQVPDFQAYLPFVEMSFIAFWLKSSFLEKKKRFVEPRLFDRFLGG